MLGKSAVFDFEAIAAVTRRESVAPQPECLVVESKSGSLAQLFAGLPRDTEIGTTLRIRMPQDYAIPEPTNPKVHPFLVYSAMTDEMVPLTKERLNQLLATERQYGQMICAIRDAHNAHRAALGYSPKPFADVGAG